MSARSLRKKRKGIMGKDKAFLGRLRSSLGSLALPSFSPSFVSSLLRLPGLIMFGSVLRYVD